MKRQKHHYIPVFYLKQWAGSNGRLIEFARRGDGKIRPRWTHPSGTGYEINLYSITGAPPEHAQTVETEFMKPFDSLAADALRALKSNTPIDLESEVSSGWARFLISLLLRNPENIAKIRAQFNAAIRRVDERTRERYAELRSPDDPATYEEYKRLATKENHFAVGEAWALPTYLSKSEAAKVIHNMIWRVRTFPTTPFTLLTSDRPIVLSIGLGNVDSFILLPVGPRRMFIAVRDQGNLDRIDRLPNDLLVRRTNEMIASQAQKYVYGTDDGQLRFVEKRLGKGLGKAFTLREVEHTPA